MTAAPARYVMIGGFLGAGKTTAVQRLAQRLHAQGERVGLITNDQGGGLVDTRVLRAQGFAVAEIAGGCFCCRFASLKDAADHLRAGEQRPTVFIAEPVGSCTDLVATVSYPLRRLYGDAYRIAPLSVLVDPLRAERVLGLAAGARFSDKVLYIYRKQLEEADLIVINKADLLDAARLERLRAALAAEFPHARVLAVSARSGAGLDAWFDAVMAGEQSAHPAMGVDYDLYADGEARLGWLNATWRLSGRGIDADRLVVDLLADVQRRLPGVEIAHLKATLTAEGGALASANLVRSDAAPELGQALGEQLDGGELVLNLRAEAEPDVLRAAVEAAIAAAIPAVVVALAAPAGGNPGLQAVREHLECFRPGRPVPTHRLAEAEVP